MNRYILLSLSLGFASASLGMESKRGLHKLLEDFNEINETENLTDFDRATKLFNIPQVSGTVEYGKQVMKLNALMRCLDKTDKNIKYENNKYSVPMNFIEGFFGWFRDEEVKEINEKLEQAEQKIKNYEEILKSRKCPSWLSHAIFGLGGIVLGYVGAKYFIPKK